MTRDIVVRPRNASDDRFIRELSSEVFSEYSRQARTRALPMAHAAITLVAEWRRKRAGFAVLKVGSRGKASLDAIAVTEFARGHGVGRSLLRAVEREARGQRARVLELLTAESNVAALGLFLRSDYAMVRKLENYYPRGQHAQLLRRRLV